MMAMNGHHYRVKSKSSPYLVEIKIQEFSPSCPTRCPVCQQMFPSATIVCEHLHSDPGCSQRFLPTPSAFHVPEKSPDKPQIGQFHPTSGYIYSFSDSNTYERMKHMKYHSEREKNPYFPFADRDEWELGKFLYAHLTQMQINDFLKLHWVGGSIFAACTIKIIFSGYL